MRRKQGYGVVYTDVMCLPISLLSKGVYAYLSARTGSKEKCFPGYHKMMDDLGIAKATISKCLNELEEHGVIEVIKTPGKPNQYFLHDHKDFRGVHEVNNTCSRDEHLPVHEVNTNKDHINKNINIYIEPEKFRNSDEFVKAWIEWCEHINFKSSVAQRKALENLHRETEGDPKKATQWIDYALSHNWNSIHEPKEQNNGHQNTTKRIYSNKPTNTHKRIHRQSASKAYKRRD